MDRGDEYYPVEPLDPLSAIIRAAIVGIVLGCLTFFVMRARTVRFGIAEFNTTIKTIEIETEGKIAVIDEEIIDIMKGEFEEKRQLSSP